MSKTPAGCSPIVRNCLAVSVLTLAACSSDTVDQQGPTSPRARLEQRLREMRDEHGRIPGDALMTAKTQRDAAVLAGPNGGGVDRGSWEWLGPDNIGGRCRALYIHPQNPLLLVLGSVSGGIWRSTNGGLSWRPADDFLPSLSVSSIVADPLDPNHLYAGTGEGFNNQDAIRGAGVFASNDAGLTWRRLPSTADANFDYVNRLSAIGWSKTTLLAATRTGIWRSTDAGSTWAQTYRATDKNGVLDIEGGIAAAVDGGVLYSTDAGQSWTKATGLPSSGVGRIELSNRIAGLAPTLYALCEIPRPDPNPDYGDLYVSSDAGKTWKFEKRFTGLGNQLWYDNAVWAIPRSVSRARLILLGGVGLFARSWERIGNKWGWKDWDISGIHADQHHIVEDPNFGKGSWRVYVCNDGGIFKAPDIYKAGKTAGWTSLNNGLGITQFYGGAIAPNGVIWGGTQDNGTLRRTRSSKSVFTMPHGADGGECAADPTDSRYLYGEEQYARVFRSTDNGVSTHDISAGLPEAGKKSAPFIAPLRLDPNDPRRLYVGVNGLWRTVDAKAATVKWQRVRAKPGSTKVTAIAIAPGNPQLVYAAWGRKLEKTTNALTSSPTWTDVSAGLPSRSILQVAVSPRRQNSVYVTLGGYRRDNVWYSRDGGRSWVPISGSRTTQLPASPIRGFAMHPHNDGWMYAGTEVGVFASTDHGATWSTTDEGPASVSVDELVFDGSWLYAFTHGRGVYRAHAATRRDPACPLYRASVSDSERQGDDHSSNPTIGGKGRRIAFSSDASNLVPGDKNVVRDVFLRDRQLGTTVRLSVDDGGNGGNGKSDEACIGRGGRYVAFSSTATNLVRSDTNLKKDVFVRDLQTGETMRESVGLTQANGDSHTPSINRDGRWLVFSSTASNLVQNDRNGIEDVFRRDRSTGINAILSVGPNGAPANGRSYTTSRCVSDDGLVVAFSSRASNLVAGDNNNNWDVFVRVTDARFGTSKTDLISHVFQGSAPGRGASVNATISGCGRYVAYDSDAWNLVSRDTNKLRDVFVYDRVAKRTQLLSYHRIHANNVSYQPVASADGKYFAFVSQATNLVPNDTNGKPDVFVYDWARSTNYRVNVRLNGIQADDPSLAPVDICDDGACVAFGSRATNLVTGDTNGRDDVFVGQSSTQNSVFPARTRSAEGSTITSVPLSSSSYRMQQIARDSNTNGVMNLRKLSFRRDGVQPSNTVSDERTIDLELWVGYGDIDEFGATFDKNWRQPPKRVIRRKRLWLPDWRTKPAALAEFDASLPFDQPLWYPFRGEVLWEARVWHNSRPNIVHPTDADASLVSRTKYALKWGLGCQTANGVFGYTATYTSDGPKSALDVTARQGPGSSPVFLMIGGRDPNFRLPGWCQALRTDALLSLALGRTTANGSFRTQLGLPAWHPDWRGARLYTQLFSFEARNNAALLSNGGRLDLPKESPGPSLLSLHATSPVAPTGKLRDWGAVFRIDEMLGR